MTDATDKIKRMIQTDGPMPVSVFMTVCLHDPEAGYYAKGAGLGRDFTTAPETSQAFGELLGIWCAYEWDAMGRPTPLVLAELGPGRGTLMADALRAAKTAPGFLSAVDLHLVEASPALRQVQVEKLSKWAPSIHKAFEDLPTGPALILANELLDCLPARQFTRDGETWRETVVGLNDAGDLAFGLAADTTPDFGSVASGQVDLQPGLEGLVDTLAQRDGPWRAILIDYGPADAAPGDTLRAFRNGDQIHPLAAPGNSDLTVDVDFSRLARLARAAGLDVAGPVPQGAFLMALGLQERLNQLIEANPGSASELFDGVRRLADPAEMGERFKVICLSSAGLPPPAGF